MPAPVFVRESTHTHSGGTSYVFSITTPAAGDGVVLFISHERVLDGGGAVLGITSITGLGATWTKVAGPISSGDLGLGYGNMVAELWVGVGCNGSSSQITISNGGNWETTLNCTQFEYLTAVGLFSTAAGTVASSGQTESVSVNPDYLYTLFVAMCVHDVTVDQEPSGFTGLADASATTPTQKVTPNYKTTNTGHTDADVTMQYRFASSPGKYAIIGAALRGGPLAAVTASAASSGSGDLAATPNVSGRTPVFAAQARIFSGADPTQQLAIIARARDLSWHDPVNDTGAGRFELALDDPQATDAILADGNIVRCYLGPFDVFDFFIETPQYELASPSGSSGERITVVGRSIEAYLERAVVWGSDVNFTGTPGGLLRQLIAAAQARGAIPWVSTDFDASADSGGVAWDSALTLTSVTISQGTNLLSVVRLVRDAGVTVVMRPDFSLQAWQSYGAARESAVVLRQGRHLAGPIRWTKPQSQIATQIIVRGATTTVVIDGSAHEGGNVGRREAIVKGPETDNVATLTQFGETELAKRLAQASPINLPVHHGFGLGEYEPYRHFSKGDTVALDAPPRFDRATEPIVAINVAAAEVGDYAVTLDLNAVQPSPLVKLKALLDALG